MRTVPVIEETSLTSLLCCENCRRRPNRKLRNGYDPETDGNWNAFHRHGVNPVVVSSGMNRELSDKKMGSQPEGQYHLHEESANCGREGEIPQGFFTTFFKGT